MLHIRKDIQLLFICLSIPLVQITVNVQINKLQVNALLEGQASLKWNKRLYNALIRHVLEGSILRCVKECLHTTRCKSINYSTTLQICELNYESGTPSENDAIKHEIGSMYGDMVYWDQAIFRSFCNGIQCAMNERCRENSTMGWCEISDCGLNIPTTSAASQTDGNGIGIHYHRTYSCDEMTDITSTVYCQPNGQWSTLNLTCNKGNSFKEICQTSGYQFEDDINLCYKVHDEFKNWTNARKICRGENADLIIINTSEIYTTVRAMNLDLKWVGATYMVEDGKWQWVDGSILSYDTVSFIWNLVNLDYRTWKTMSDGDCLRYANGYLIGNNCNNTQGFICQRKWFNSIVQKMSFYN